MSQSINSAQSCFGVTQNHDLTRVNIAFLESFSLSESGHMLRENNRKFLLDRLDHEGTDVAHGGSLIDIAVLDIVSRGTSRTDQFLADESARSEWGIVKTTEGTRTVILIGVLQNDDLVCGVEKLIVEGVTN